MRCVLPRRTFHTWRQHFDTRAATSHAARRQADRERSQCPAAEQSRVQSQPQLGSAQLSSVELYSAQL